MTPLTPNDITRVATLAERVWVKAPEARPPQVAIGATDTESIMFSLAHRVIDPAWAGVWEFCDDRTVHTAIALIESACMDLLDIVEFIKQSDGRWCMGVRLFLDGVPRLSWTTTQPTRVEALLLAVEWRADQGAQP